MTGAGNGMPDTSEGAAQLLARVAVNEPDRVFARFEGEAITISELDRHSSRLSAWLDRAGIQPGHRVAVMLHNSPLSLALLFAIAKSGAVWVPINVQSRGGNLAYVLGHSAPQLIICEDDLARTVHESGVEPDLLRGLKTATELGSAAGPAPSDGQGSPAPLGADPDAAYAIMYTSGTTGPPKGVIVSHRMLRLAAEAVAIVSGVRTGDIMLMWEPLFHIGGAQMILLPLIRNVTLAMTARFSASRFWEQARAERATHIHFLGGILQILLKQPPTPRDRDHNVRIAWGGGCPREIWSDFETRFGVEIRECYGMTECSSVTTLNDRGVIGSVGRPVPWFQVDLLDSSDKPVAAGERGEIVVRTRLPGALTRGYLNDPRATARALRDGSFHTGDWGSIDDDGNFYFHGRMTDSVRVKGHNVSAFEVEHVAAKHPDVEDCAMIGVAAEVGEQDIKLFVKQRPGSMLQAAALWTWLEQRLAPYQLPRYIVMVDEFERTPSQRIMKHALSASKATAWDRHAESPARGDKVP